MFLLSSADFFQNQLFLKILSGTSECQTVWIQIRTDILSVLLWVQTVCKGYQQTTKVTTSMERVLLPYMYFKDLPVNSFTEAIDLMTAGGKITGEFIVAIEWS